MASEGAKLKGSLHDFRRVQERRALVELDDHGKDLVWQTINATEAKLPGCVEKGVNGDLSWKTDGVVTVERRHVEPAKGHCRAKTIASVVEDCKRRMALREEQMEAGKVNEGGTCGHAPFESEPAEADVVALPDFIAWMKPKTCRDGFPGSSREGLGVYYCACQRRIHRDERLTY